LLYWRLGNDDLRVTATSADCGFRLLSASASDDAYGSRADVLSGSTRQRALRAADDIERRRACSRVWINGAAGGTQRGLPSGVKNIADAAATTTSAASRRKATMVCGRRRSFADLWRPFLASSRSCAAYRHLRSASATHAGLLNKVGALNSVLRLLTTRGLQRGQRHGLNVTGQRVRGSGSIVLAGLCSKLGARCFRNGTGAGSAFVPAGRRFTGRSGNERHALL